MMTCAADGMLVNIPDTSANRAMFGSTGTADDSAPFPQIRIIAVTARAGRALLGAILGGSAAGEQTLLKRLVRRRPDLVADRVICFDRNFPGHDLITAIVDAGGHVVARLKAGISLPAEPGGWLPDGSRLTWLNAPSGNKEDRLPVRAAEHNVILPGGDGDLVLGDLHPAGPPGRARGRHPRDLPDPVKRVGDHVRRRQGHDHRRREPHLRPILRSGPRSWSSRKPGPG